MADRLKQIPAKMLEWWNRFASKQKITIVFGTAGFVFLLVAIVAFLARPQYMLLINCGTAKESSEIKEMLDAEGIIPQVSDDGLQIQVLAAQMSNARMILGANNILAVTYDIDNVTSGGFAATESDKQKKYVQYLEKTMQEDLMTMGSIKKVDIQLSLPENDGTQIAKEEAYASVILELDGEFNQDQAAAVARIIATALGNETTNNIVIIDSEGNLLFSGEDNYSVSGSASNQLTVKQQAEI